MWSINVDSVTHKIDSHPRENKIPTLLVFEEAHHELRPVVSSEEANENSFA
jgi:hypothetical protein